jgi:hypothetical protein
MPHIFAVAHALAALLLLTPAPSTGPAPAAPAPAPVAAPAPAPAPAPVAATPAKAGTGSVTGAVTIVKDSPTGKPKADRSGVVVYLEAPMDPELEDRLLDQPPPVHAIRQVNKAFVPAVSAVLRGTEVSFPNDDMIFHNVFSLSKARRFDLGLYKSGTSKSITLSRPGIIDVYCNIHPEMAAKILVLDNPYFAVTGVDGRFTIADVPPGTYNYVAWQVRGAAVRGQITVVAGAPAKLDPVLVETPQSSLHTRKDGSPYGRYN